LYKQEDIRIGALMMTDNRGSLFSAEVRGAHAGVYIFQNQEQTPNEVGRMIDQAFNSKYILPASLVMRQKPTNRTHRTILYPHLISPIGICVAKGMRCLVLNMPPGAAFLTHMNRGDANPQLKLKLLKEIALGTLTLFTLYIINGPTKVVYGFKVVHLPVFTVIYRASIYSLQIMWQLLGFGRSLYTLLCHPIVNAKKM